MAMKDAQFSRSWVLKYEEEGFSDLEKMLYGNLYFEY